MNLRSALLLTTGLAILIGIGLTGANGQKTKQPGKADTASGNRETDRQAIQKTVKSFLEAFEKGDAKSLAEHWTPAGEYIAGNGNPIRGRTAILKAYTDYFKTHPNSRVEIETKSLRFVSNDTAIEEGYFKVRQGKAGERTVNRYSVLHVREKGQWKMAVVREWPGEGTTLRDIEWLIGTWSAQRDGTEVLTTYEWSLDRSFIQARFTTKHADGTTTATQMIGKDPTTGQLRSWLFQSAGGFGETVWSRDRQRWVLQARETQADGSTLEATNILNRIDDDTFTWHSTNRFLDEIEVPNLPPIKVTRVKKK